MVENPVTTFPIEKRINTEMFIDRAAAFWVGKTRISVVTNKGYQQVGNN